jgi:transposase
MGRRFYDHAKSGHAPIASEALERIAALYAIEKTIRGASAEKRRSVRQERSKPLVAALKTWLERQLARVSAKATIAEDLRYGLNHWDGLTRFLDELAALTLGRRRACVRPTICGRSRWP